MTSRCLLTGATGFIGNVILKKKLNIVVLGRSCPVGFAGKYIESELSAKVDYVGCFENIDSIIHCAGRVHVTNEQSSDPLQAYREINVDGTLNLAGQAADAGVKRFIFISSIKVNGEGTKSGFKFSTGAQSNLKDPYGISKYEAEQGLIELSQKTNMELVIIRPTLVYGPGVKGNFLSLLKLSKMGIPLPFGAIYNARSMVYLENLVDLIITCVEHPNAEGKIFLASDGDDISLSRLLGLIRKNMNKSARLFPVPAILFKLLGKLTGKGAVIERLIGNLQVDSSDAQKYLNWHPRYTVEQGIKTTVVDFEKRTNIKR